MKHIGEVITVRSGILLVEGKRNALPSLGSILKSEEGILCIVVSHSIDNRFSGRTPMPYGKPLSVLEKEHPQVFALMKWMFQAIPFGRIQKNAIELFLSNAVEIHMLLYKTEESEQHRILKESRFFDFLFSVDKNVFPQRDNMIISLINSYIAHLPIEQRNDEYIRIFSYMSKILKNDYQTLKRIMDGVTGVTL